MNAGIAWMKASGCVWMPGLGGISTRPSPFSRKAVVNRRMIVGRSIATLATSAAER
jgi:hypothetical protein